MNNPVERLVRETSTVSILGGYGDLGQAAARALLETTGITVRVGGRNIEVAQQCCAQLGAMAHPWRVDYSDEQSMSEFLNDVDVLLNCAGPSWQIQDKAVKAALAANVDYVDVAGDEGLYDLLLQNGTDCSNARVLLSAGLQPGLSAILPAWFAQQAFSSLHSLYCYTGIWDGFTRVAADDFLQGAVNGHSEPLAIWRNGALSNARTRQDNVSLPFFSESGVLLPSLSSENQRLARDLGLQHGEWYSFITGKHIKTAFERVMSLCRSEAAETLRQASLLDLAGTEPWVISLLQGMGINQHGEEVTKTLLFRGLGNAAISGALAASAVTAVLAGHVPHGCHYAAQVLDPASVMADLQQVDVVAAISWFDETIDDLMDEEEGVL